MRNIAVVVLIAICGNAQAGDKTANPFLKLKYDRVVMYDFQPIREKGGSIINSQGQLGGKILKQMELSTAEAKDLSTRVWQWRSYGQGTAACFDPHLGFVYYSGDKVVAYLTICMDCNRIYASRDTAIDIPAKKQGKQVYDGEVYYTGDGMSRSFRHFLNGLLKKNEFSHQVEKGTMWGGY